jgi:integrase/recombinase XerD
MLLRLAIDEFLQFCRVERQLSENTLAAYEADLEDFKRSLAADVLLTSITEEVLQGYLAQLVMQRKLSVATVRRRFACLRTFIRRSARQHAFADPFASWQLRLPRRKRLPRALSRAEVSSLLGRSTPRQPPVWRRDGDLAVAMLLMVSTGIRVGELCKLKLDDLAPGGASIRIHGKGSRDRIAYITDLALQSSLQRLADQRRQKEQEHQSLFLNRNGMPMKPQSIRCRLRRHAREAGLVRRITPHMLRHTAATLLIETGVDIRFVQRLLGHSSIATTEIYTHVSDEALRATLARADVLNLVA